MKLKNNKKGRKMNCLKLACGLVLNVKIMERERENMKRCEMGLLFMTQK